jgi:aerobic-type carbon monoxide dehydrogenase small subunit (CoxS/CutS family)
VKGGYVEPVLVRLTLNGSPREVMVPPSRTLLHVIREELGATEVKYGCGEGVCGACTVLLDGEPVSSCLVFALQADGSSVVTVRGLSAEGSLHPLQERFLEHGAAQCGFCTPGILLTLHAFLAEHPAATREEIRRALAGNLCRCTGYTQILDAAEAHVRSGLTTVREDTDGES